MVITKTEKVTEGLYRVESLPCPKCQTTLAVFIDSEMLYKYNQNAPIGLVLPHLSLEDRERFISGYCPECWNNLFPDEDDEEGDDE